MENQKSKSKPETVEQPSGEGVVVQRLVSWAYVENMVTLTAFVLVAIFAPGAWKLLSLAAFLNINYVRKTKDDSSS
jgi:hypothetical protein